MGTRRIEEPFIFQKMQRTVSGESQILEMISCLCEHRSPAEPDLRPLLHIYGLAFLKLVWSLDCLLRNAVIGAAGTLPLS